MFKEGLIQRTIEGLIANDTQLSKEQKEVSIKTVV